MLTDLPTKLNNWHWVSQMGSLGKPDGLVLVKSGQNQLSRYSCGAGFSFIDCPEAQS
jgi:hypothetical protein